MTTNLRDFSRELSVLKAIQSDCKDDAKALDGKPFNGASIGEMNGKMLAMIDALAVVLERTIKELAEWQLKG